MAYIIGLLTDDEEKELIRRGWTIENFKESYFDNCKLKMVFVDNDMFEIMNGPDWEKGLEK